MSLNSHQPPENLGGQSPGCDPKAKRNSGLFAFLKWFKPSTSRESIDDDNNSRQSSSGGSCDSLNSTNSNATVASFSYVPPGDYPQNKKTNKCLVVGPETDTYKARLKQRDKRRENDKNLTLRKKYNLFFHRDATLSKPAEEENSRSLPLMTRTTMDPTEEEKIHRRTNSESSKTKRAGAYLHVKGKRKAPQPPGLKQLNEGTSTMSLRRKKRLAPPPPPSVAAEKIIATLNGAEEVIFNDSLKLDHGILKPAKEASLDVPHHNNADGNSANSPNTSARSSYAEAPVSPRPWYKRNNANKTKDVKEAPKYEPIEVPFTRNSSDLNSEESRRKSEDNRRKSGMSFLTNISELDREASEIIKKEHSRNNDGSGGDGDLQEIPQFMRPKDHQEPKINADSWVSPKRRSSAKDLIAKFNAITNVTKVTVNTALFGGTASKDAKRDYFGKRISLSEDKRHQESLLESHKKRLEHMDGKKLGEAKFNSPLMKSESASAIKSSKSETPKFERKSWNCPKCSVENEYWRIICHVCSAIKPYFDDLGVSPISKNSTENADTKPTTMMNDKILERSKTQIGFSALASYNLNRRNFEKSISMVESKTEKDPSAPQINKTEDRERLKKMLIEMKNSLPKRRSNILMKQNSRTSIIVENSDNEEDIRHEILEKPEDKKNPCKEKIAEVIIATQETVYENIKVKKTDNPKPIKVSSSAQTTSGFNNNEVASNKNEMEKKKTPQIKENGVKSIIKEEPMKIIENKKILAQTPDVIANRKSFELMRPKDFENIYTDSNSQSPARVYANLARNDELSLFFNVPKKINEIKNNMNQNLLDNKNTDTIEINRLLRRLESAIAKGELTEASIYAKELAQLKINCSVVRQNSQNLGKKTKGFNIEMYVEDKISHRGPFTIEVTENQTVAELKIQVEQEFEIPANVQRWILGKELASNDDTTLKDHKITSEGCPVFLYLVAPDSSAKTNIDIQKPITSTRTAPEEIKIEPSTSKLSTAMSNEIKPVNRPKLTESGGAVTKNPTPDENKLFRRSISEIPKVAPASREIRKVKTVEEIEMRIPKIVDVIPKTVETFQIENKDEILKRNNSTCIEIKIEENKIKRPNAVMVRQDAVEVKPIQVELKAKHEAPELPKLQLNQAKVETVKVIEPQSPLAAKIENNTKTPQFQIPTVIDNNNDDGEDYDSKTLKPQPKDAKEWECHLCTLLNPISSNICAICATVRQNKEVQPLRKSIKNKKAPQPTNNNNATNASTNNDQTYLQLVNLDNKDLVENLDTFECLVCFMDIEPGQGITLRECIHQFCKACLAHTIEYTEDAEVKCPYRDDDYSCNIALQDREIKALVTPKMYEQHLAKSVKEAENKIGKSFHCKTPDCRGWCIFEDNVNEFYCPVCRRINCLTCQAIHMGLNCKQYQEKLNQESEMDEDTKRTKEMFAEMVRKGEALTCPTCQVILMKKWGCDWVRCSMCKTEICWVTRGPRWGPGGKGDTSGGCQCGVNGVKCHPQCSYCH